jgi:hypothetical protein
MKFDERHWQLVRTRGCIAMGIELLSFAHKSAQWPKNGRSQ